MTSVYRKRLTFMALACALGAMPLGVVDREAAAQSGGRVFNPVQNWLPDDFQIACGAKAGPFRPSPRDTPCIAYPVQIDYETNVWSAAQAYKAAGFVSPYNFGPVINSYGSEGRSVRVFTDVTGRSTLASVESRASPRSSKNCDRESYRFMAVNPSLLRRYPSYAVGLVASHELFHAVQFGIPGELKPNRHRLAKCLPPKWVTESHADAAAIDFTRREFPSSFPPTPGQRFATNMAGLRPYYIPLNYKHDLTAYDTNSFWLYIGDYFHNRKFKYLEDYAKASAPAYSDGKEDWLHWLDERLRNDPKINTPLYLFYPGFLTHFAGEWAPGGVGEKFRRVKWLAKAFGRCESVTLSPQNPYEEIEVGLHKVAGKCLSVTITGLGSSDLVSVKIGAFTDREDIVDSLHLGFAFTNDRTGFNCAQFARKFRPPPGIAGCLFEPVTGILETGTASLSAARMWYASSLELGPGVAQGNVVAGGEIENVYVLSYVPPEPWEEMLEGKPPITVKIGVGLEWSSLSVNGSTVNSGSADGKRSATRRRAVAAKGLTALEADMTVPQSTGWVDDQGMDAIMGGGLFDLFGEARRMGSELALEVDPTEMVRRVRLFSLADARIVPLGGAPSEERIEVVREFHVSPLEPLPDGATGTFPATIGGGNRERGSLYFSERVGDATLTVEENSHGAFRAKVSGEVCVVEQSSEDWMKVVKSARLEGLSYEQGLAELERIVPQLAAVTDNFDYCPRKVHVSGAISKPFAFLYRGETRLVSVETEGEKLYNRYGPPRLMRGMFGGGDGDGDGDGAGGGAGGGGGGAGSSFCQCTCPDLAVPSTELCRAQCQPQWAMCEIAAETPPEPAPAPKPPTPTVEAQRKWFSRLVGGQGLPPEVEEMLIEDFVTMSDETRRYLIRQYRGGVR